MFLNFHKIGQFRILKASLNRKKVFAINEEDSLFIFGSIQPNIMNENYKGKKKSKTKGDDTEECMSN